MCILEWLVIILLVLLVIGGSRMIYIGQETDNEIKKAAGIAIAMFFMIILCLNIIRLFDMFGIIVK